MQQPGRRSLAALSVAVPYAVPERIEPPAELGQFERDLFVAIVAEQRAGHFFPTDASLLARFCTAAGIARRATEALAAEPMGTPRAATLEASHAQAARTMAALTVKLRIGPASRAPNKSRRAGPERPASLSYYDQLALQRGRDG